MTHTQPILKQVLITGLVSAVSLSFYSVQPSFAESLFRANASYTTNVPVTPNSLFTQPRPRSVGDTVTIVIAEENKQEYTTRTRLSKNHSIEENGTSLFNSFFKFMVGKVPFVEGKELKDPAFSFNGLDNSNNIDSTANATKTNKFSDTVSCQVVQVLPNGHLVVQGKKTTLMTKERADFYVTGIVDPFFLDKKNQINSKQVANFQFMVSGKGIISRQQNDGIVNKVYQFFQ